MKKNRSFMNKLKRSDPSIKPCGTPAITSFKLLNFRNKYVHQIVDEDFSRLFAHPYPSIFLTELLPLSSL